MEYLGENSTCILRICDQPHEELCPFPPEKRHALIAIILAVTYAMVIEVNVVNDGQFQRTLDVAAKPDLLEPRADSSFSRMIGAVCRITPPPCCVTHRL